MLTTILLGLIGGPELGVIVVALLLLFGGKKIPELMRGLGQGVKAFKDGQTEEPNAKEPETEESGAKNSNTQEPSTKAQALIETPSKQ